MSVVDYIANLEKPSMAMKFNGIYFEDEILGYRTNKVTGRESLQSNVTEKSMDLRDFSIFSRNRRLSRDITVEFAIVTDTPEQYKRSVDKLKQYSTNYNSKAIEMTESRIIFDDESDRYYKGVVSGIELNELVDNCSGSGKITIHCADPCKYSIEAYHVDLNCSEAGNEIYYDGTYMAYPEFHIRGNYTQWVGNPDGIGYYGLINQDGKTIQIGTPDEIEPENPRTKSEVIFDDNFTTGVTRTGNTMGTLNWPTGNQGSGQVESSGWWVNAAGTTDLIKVSSAFNPAGTTGSATNSIIKVKGVHTDSYGSAPTYTGWHGPVVTRDSSFDDSNGNHSHINGTFEVKSTVVAGSNDYGEFVMSLDRNTWDSNNNRHKVAIAKLVFYKSQAGSTKGHINLMTYKGDGENQRGGKTEKQLQNIDFGSNGSVTKATNVNNSDGAIHKITKIGKKITFDINGTKLSFENKDIPDDLTIDSVSFAFGKYQDKTPITNNVVYSATFTSHSVNDEKDIPNKFKYNDSVHVLTENGEIRLNGVQEYGLGALGNDWETFYLKPGKNVIYCTFSGQTYSETETPYFTMDYRKVWL